MELINFAIVFLAVCAAYLLGAVPTGYWLCHGLFGIDITRHGSGNIGASNVGRAAGKQFFIFVFILDALKAFAAVFLLAPLLVSHLEFFNNHHIFFITESVVAACVLIGNAYSIFIGMRGGKGVAASVGILCALAPWWMSVLFIIAWIITLYISKQAFIASIISMLIVLIATAFDASMLAYTVFGMFCWLLMRHHANIRSMCNRCCPCPWNKH